MRRFIVATQPMPTQLKFSPCSITGAIRRGIDELAYNERCNAKDDYCGVCRCAANSYRNPLQLSSWR
jgi:hypothetical protein